jgi:hypothetical protein
MAVWRSRCIPFSRFPPPLWAVGSFHNAPTEVVSEAVRLPLPILPSWTLNCPSPGGPAMIAGARLESWSAFAAAACNARRRFEAITASRRVGPRVVCQTLSRCGDLKGGEATSDRADL